MTYNELSKQVGFIGSMPFPDITFLKSLCKELAMTPSIERYRRALEIYRFSPEAENDNQKMAILLLRNVMYHAQNSLWDTGNIEKLNKLELKFLKK